MGDKDFFLSPDDAMTMGDINFMRKSKRTRRTFPKTLKNKDGFAIENEVSSLEDRSNFYKDSDTNQNTTVNTVFNPTNSVQPQASGSAIPQQSTFEPTQQSSEKRRPVDNSMDMFRNMAKKMRR